MIQRWRAEWAAPVVATHDARTWEISAGKPTSGPSDDISDGDCAGCERGRGILRRHTGNCANAGILRRTAGCECVAGNLGQQRFGADGMACGCARLSIPRRWSRARCRRRFRVGGLRVCWGRCEGNADICQSRFASVCRIAAVLRAPAHPDGHFGRDRH